MAPGRAGKHRTKLYDVDSEGGAVIANPGPDSWPAFSPEGGSLAGVNRDGFDGEGVNVGRPAAAPPCRGVDETTPGG